MRCHSVGLSRRSLRDAIIRHIRPKLHRPRAKPGHNRGHGCNRPHRPKVTTGRSCIVPVRSEVTAEVTAATGNAARAAQLHRPRTGRGPAEEARVPAAPTEALRPPHVAGARFLSPVCGAAITAQPMRAPIRHPTPTTRHRAPAGVVDVPRLWDGVKNPPTCRAVKTNDFQNTFVEHLQSLSATYLS